MDGDGGDTRTSYGTITRRSFDAPKDWMRRERNSGHRTVSQTAEYAELDASLAGVVAAELG